MMRRRWTNAVCRNKASRGMSSPIFRTAVLVCLLSSMVLADDGDGRCNWPQWSGPLGTGVAPHAEPLQWSESDGRNIRWETPLPGRGRSTPIVWGDRLFLTAAISVGEALPPRYSKAKGAHDNVPVTQKFAAIAIDRPTGKTIWQ